MEEKKSKRFTTFVSSLKGKSKDEARELILNELSKALKEREQIVSDMKQLTKEREQLVSALNAARNMSSITQLQA